MKQWTKARDVLVNSVKPVEKETVAVDDSLGMMLAETVVTDGAVSISGEKIASAGDTVLKPKRALTPAMIAALKVLGKKEVKVRRNALLSVANVAGSEDISGAVLSLVKTRGKTMFVTLEGSTTIQQSVSALKEIIAQDSYGDCLLVFGGEKDHFISAINELDGQVLYDFVAISPGSDSQAAIYDGKLILRFPPELVTVITLMELLLAPAIRSMMKIIDQPQEYIRGEFKGEFESDKELVTALPVKVKYRNGLAQFRPVALKNNQDIFGFRNVEGLVILPADSGSYDKYSIVDFLPFPWSEWLFD